MSDDPADWGVFGDYFGGVFNPLIALITLFVTIKIAIRLNEIENRNHSESLNSQVKPLITIQDGISYSSDISRIGLTADLDFYSYDEPTQPINQFSHLHYQPFPIKVLNLGLGIAKDVEFKFEIDLSKCKEAIDFSDSDVRLLMEDKGKNTDTNESVSHLSWKMESREVGSARITSPVRKFVGIVNNNREASINVPIPTQFMTAFQLFNLRRKRSGADKEFPTIIVSVNYKNIHELGLEAQFRMGVFSVRDYPSYSVYRLLVEQISISN